MVVQQYLDSVEDVTLFPCTKGRLKQTKTRTDSAAASSETVLRMKDVFM